MVFSPEHIVFFDCSRTESLWEKGSCLNQSRRGGDAPWSNGFRAIWMLIFIGVSFFSDSIRYPGLSYSNVGSVEFAEHETERSAEQEEAEWCLETLAGRKIRLRYFASCRIETSRHDIHGLPSFRLVSEVPDLGHRISSGHLAPIIC